MRVFKRRVRGRLSRHFYASWTQDGRTVLRTTGKSDRRAAELVAASWERRQADPTYRASDETPLSAALSRLIAEKRRQGRADGTLHMYEEKARSLLKALGDISLSRVDARAVDHLITVREKDGAKRPTIHKELVVLRGALFLSKRRGEYAGDPASIFPRGFSGKSIPKQRFLTLDEARGLLQELRPSVGAKVAFILATGARLSELDRVRREDVNLEQGFVRIRGTKTRLAFGEVPILSFLRPLLRYALEFGGGTHALFIKTPGLRSSLRWACRRAGIERVTPNDLRRSLGSWLGQNGASLYEISRVLRHSSTRMAEETYVVVERDHLSALLEKKLEHVRPILGTPE